ncbi:L-aspartate oxidase [Paracoccus seriniphilus]|uniref:L-aspartate oxidase n=1 Tax=Paracoccus seriniphilus TaxID=184748 RepID=A0A239PX78_9RHOB|nr:L-aspartate oxidase [Paracoccus seriniphilus]WCR13166.1 L-aspartate oxidase [Paracoccus seriniphilus]SNT74532.1 L-aspartate oxidase [Paracoccus seriniphilus]
MHQINTNRVVIVGAGLAALYAALKLAPRPVLMISPDPLGEGASSAWAQGGVAAAMSGDDSAEAHARDTMRAGAGSVDAEIARMVTDEAQAHILDLTSLGTPFDRSADGGYVMSREAAHSFARVVRVRGDQAGAEIMRALISQTRATPSIQVLEGVVATGLIRQGNAIAGVSIAKSEGSASLALHAPAVLLAGGGSGGLYAITTNPPRIRGEVIGMAARAGAVIADAEFVQFHPTAIDCGIDPAPLATEALRGEGAHLLNAAGERFMPAVHPDAELAPRDIVARAIYAQTQAGQRPMLDTRDCLGPRILTEFPAVAEACAKAGIDPVTQAIPVAAAAHYHMGGVAVGANGRASLEGLWVCGEASSTGLHGANRLASNGLLEALVFGRICAMDIADSIAPFEDEAEPVKLPELPVAPLARDDLVQELRQAMTRGAGVLRNAAGLQQTLATIARIEAAQPGCDALLNMTATATLICAAAYERRESRGAHCRDDFPNAAEPARRSRMTLQRALALRDTLLSEVS